MEKKTTYEAPTLVEVGSFEDITQGSSTGSSLDAPFPTGTPGKDLTFS